MAQRKKSLSVRVGRRFKPELLAEQYDAVVVGSGPGGLAAAVCLAKQGRSVAVFEQHYTAGGYTHAYTRRGWEWDVGIHYVGHLGPGEPVRVLSDYLTEGALQWAWMGEVYDEYRIGGETYTAPAGLANYRQRLIAQFPAERAGIEEFFRRANRCVPAIPTVALARLGRGAQLASRVLGAIAVPEYAKRPAGEVVADLTSDEKLRAALLGMPTMLTAEPSSNYPFLALALLYHHYKDGGFYPVGGSQQIAATMLPIIRRTGGEVFVEAEVREILLEDGRADGVRLADGTTVHAPLVISDAGARNTFETLLPAEVTTRIGYDTRLAEVQDGASFLVLFVGLDGSPEELKLPSHNIVTTGSADIDVMLALDGPEWTPMEGAFISFSSAKDPTWPDRHPGRSTGQVITAANAAWFQEWAATDWNKRGPDYEALKQRISTHLLDALYREVPQTQGKVIYHELSTPLSSEHFGRWRGGSLYGTAMDTENLLHQGDWLRPHTPIPGLHLSGQDAFTGGLIGAAVGGVLAAHDALSPLGRARLWAGLAATGAGPLPSHIASRARRRLRAPTIP